MQITAAVFRDATLKPSYETLEMSGPGPGEALVRLVATGRLPHGCEGGWASVPVAASRRAGP